MRTSDEIADAAAAINAAFPNGKAKERVEAAIRTITENLSNRLIETYFYDTEDPWPEQAAIKAREWLDGDIELSEFVENV